MRNSNLAEALFPKTRQGILSATYGQPERWWYLSEIADWLETTPSSLQRELESLSKNGILRTKREGNRLYFQAETDSPIFAPLRELVAQTLGIVSAFEEAIAPFENKINAAFFYGSIAGGAEHSLSDVDLMILGSVGLAELATVLRELEKKFKREINVSCYKTSEFKDKLQSGNHFLSGVLEGEKLFIIGNKDELDRLVK